MPPSSCGEGRARLSLLLSDSTPPPSSVSQVKPSPSLGSLQAALWLGPFTLAVVCATGRVKLLQYLRHEDFFTLTEESCAVCDAGVVTAALLATGHVAIAHSSKVVPWGPLAH